MPSSIEKKNSAFFESRRKEDSDRAELLNQSHELYSGGKICSFDFSCVRLCSQIFSLDFDQKDCKRLPATQVYQLEKLYQYILKKELRYLQEINVFDLKLFLNLSPEPLYKFFRTLGPVFKEQLLIWFASDWEVAAVFSEEDWDFLFLDIFLNEAPLHPISFLKREIFRGRTFAELAWLKQNDFALFWLDNYFKKAQCLGLEGEKADNCVLAQYCYLSTGFQSDVLKEIMGFKNLQLLLDKKQNLPKRDLGSVCSAFCASEKDQNYCN